VVQPTDIYNTATLDKATLPPGVKWVGGDWCMAPPPKSIGPQAASRALALQLVQKVANDADTHEIEALLRQDPTLSYHLLRLVNSLGMGSSRKVTSFSQAILILGRAQLRRWLNLMLFAARQGDVRSNMLLARVAVRARALELLAKAAGLDRTQQEQAFMTGMFSLLGVLFGMPLEEVLAPLALSDTVQGALLRYEGDVGAMLALLEAAEKGQFESIAAKLAALHIEPEQFNEAIVEANAWMLGTLKESQG
jgi:EAL and modified HD-GYP domain-containing signal transduction protein